MHRMKRWTFALLAATALGGCTDVTNPGPVQEAFLDDPAAFAALVAGSGRAVAEGLNWIGYTSAAVTREVHPSGSTGSFGITVRWQRGELNPTDDAIDVHWEQAQQARWLAEESVRRLEAADGVDPELLAQAYLWAGFANRVLGENMCQAVIDGGEIQPNSVFFDRAEANFTSAMNTGSGDVALAAQGGRAAARIFLGDWAGATSDAAAVLAADDEFQYVIPYYDIGEDAQKNRIQFSTAAEPYKAHTQWNTKYEDVGLNENNPDGDPRVAYTFTDEVGDAAIDCCGTVPWWPQAKYEDPGADMDLVTADEMQLIEAEGLLRDGMWPEAMLIINDVRADAGVDPAVATTEEEAWAALKNERGIVLWLEARRLGDFRRWDAEGTPGALDPLEIASGDTSVGSHLAQQDLCFPIPPSEQDTNPNVPSAS